MYTLLKWSCFLLACGLFGLYLGSTNPAGSSAIGPQVMILPLIILSFAGSIATMLSWIGWRAWRWNKGEGFPRPITTND
jgi:hypothetical protein